jgi:hypothetical protein
MTHSVARREPWAATINAPTVRQLRQEVGRAHRRGELAASGPIQPVPGGGFQVSVYRLKPPRRRRVPAAAWVAGGVTSLLGGAAMLGWWLVDATAPLIAAWVPALGVGLAVRGVIGLLVRQGGSCTITHTRHR